MAYFRLDVSQLTISRANPKYDDSSNSARIFLQTTRAIWLLNMYAFEHSSKLDLDSFAELICLYSVAQPFGLSFACFTLKKILE